MLSTKVGLGPINADSIFGIRRRRGLLADLALRNIKPKALLPLDCQGPAMTHRVDNNHFEIYFRHASFLAFASHPTRMHLEAVAPSSLISPQLRKAGCAVAPIFGNKIKG